MDILKKMFGLNGVAEKDAAINDKNAKSKVPAFGNDFKKPLWYDEESDDELFDNNKMFGFQVFSNPMEIQKYHEQQMQRMLKSFGEFDEVKTMLDDNVREEYMKPGFENVEKFTNAKPSVDIDLDGEIYADQLHSLLQRISPEMENMRAKALAPKKPEESMRKLTDEERVMDQIHCIDEGEKRILPFKKHSFDPLNPSNRDPDMMKHFKHSKALGGAFEGIADGPRTFRQTVSRQVVRKPDGTYETTTVVDPSGNTKTVIKSTVNGHTKTQTLINGVDVNDKNAIAGVVIKDEAKPNDWIIDCGRHFYVNKAGYALPKNLW